jgi:hypothetical protein
MQTPEFVNKKYYKAQERNSKDISVYFFASTLSKKTSFVILVPHLKPFSMEVFMRTTSLPIIDQAAGLDEALDVIRRAKTRGVVTSNGANFELHLSKNLIAAKANSSLCTLSDMQGIPLHVGLVKQRNRATAARSLSDRILVSELKKSGEKYGLVSVTTGTVKKARIFAIDDQHFSFVEPGPKDRPKKSPFGSGE